MSVKRSPSIIPRFKGANGKKNLLEAVRSQRLVAGDAGLARKLIKAGELREFASDKYIVRQGDSDNDLFLIISGSVGVVINDREIGARFSGTHVGEMAILDPTARRSASIITKEKTATLRVSEDAVTRIATEYPDFWRRMAVELASRLRERSKYIHQPNSISQVFIGSSSEAEKEASCLHKSLSRKDLTCTLWTKGVFHLSQTIIEDLVQQTVQMDFAVLLLTPDDLTFSRSKQKASPRDNVVFELGLFMGAIGRHRTYIVVPSGIDIKLPTDLLGVTHAKYSLGSESTLGRRMSAVTRTLYAKINQLGPK